MAAVYYEGKKYFLLQTKSLPEAEKIVDLAKLKKEDGTFLEWLKSWREEKGKEKPEHQGGLIEK